MKRKDTRNELRLLGLSVYSRDFKVIEMPSVYVPGRGELKKDFDDCAKTRPLGSKNLLIFMKTKDLATLENPRFQESQARKLFNWMLDNLPSGIFQRLYFKMKKYERECH